MQTCDGCKCQAWDLFEMPDNQRLCEYCSRSWVAAANERKEIKKKEYNNVKYFIREDFGSVANWAMLCGIKPSQAVWVLSERNTNSRMTADFSTTQIRVLNLLIYSGFGEYLVSDGYITKKWLKEAKQLIKEV